VAASMMSGAIGGGGIVAAGASCQAPYTHGKSPQSAHPVSTMGCLVDPVLVLLGTMRFRGGVRLGLDHDFRWSLAV
jgi:hypothetical protein